ncbi:MAG: divalent-cation tolerance protein CutA [Pseudomonadota bacterium]
MTLESNIILLYVPCPTDEVARLLAVKTVELDLAFCAQVFPKMHSYYKWEGKLNTDEEVLLILKTQTHLETKLREQILDLHPYQVPCILKIIADSLNPAYTEWVISAK